MSFELIQSNIEMFDFIVYSINYLNPLDELDDIMKALKLKNYNKGTLCFDLLLSNGDSYNRFVRADYNGKEILRDSMEIISMSTKKELHTINSFYRKNKKHLQNGILTTSEQYRTLMV